MAQNVEDIFVGPEAQVPVDAVDIMEMHPVESDVSHLSLVDGKAVSSSDRSHTLFLWLFLPLVALFFVLV